MPHLDLARCSIQRTQSVDSVAEQRCSSSYFKTGYRRTTCIIDCSEVFIERPASMLACFQTYLDYKSHNTFKFLVAISPTGAVIFVSKCWGGRVSDNTWQHIVVFFNTCNLVIWSLQIEALIYLMNWQCVVLL